MCDYANVMIEFNLICNLFVNCVPFVALPNYYILELGTPIYFQLSRQ